MVSGGDLSCKKNREGVISGNNLFSECKERKCFDSRLWLIILNVDKNNLSGGFNNKCLRIWVILTLLGRSLSGEMGVRLRISRWIYCRELLFM